MPFPVVPPAEPLPDGAVGNVNDTVAGLSNLSSFAGVVVAVAGEELGDGARPGRSAAERRAGQAAGGRPMSTEYVFAPMPADAVEVSLAASPTVMDESEVATVIVCDAPPTEIVTRFVEVAAL